MVCEATVPLALVVHVLPEPPVIVPRLVKVLDQTVLPIAKAGEPTVVKTLPALEAVNSNGAAEDQLKLNEVFQFPEPPTQ
tara:strand:- start:187 stop:426 length:240 start_codon:yes stop_codon:yes gene_type:complete